MAVIKAFRGFRPLAEHAKALASRPYDVLNSAEARIEVKGNLYSFLHVVKPEIDLPKDINPYSDEVYQKGRDNFLKFVEDGVMIQDESDCLYIYRLTMDDRKQTGIVAAAAVDDYLNDVIKKHELTRPDKEEDRKKHVRVSNINAEPVFFAYPEHPQLDAYVADLIEDMDAAYDFEAEDGIRHEVWVISDPTQVGHIISYFAEIPNTYVADGHHRTAAAALVGKERRDAKPNYTGKEEFNFFLAVHFPDNHLQIFDYNRVVKDLNGHSEADFIEKLKENFELAEKGTEAYRPAELHELSMYLGGKWYSLKAKDHTYDDHDPIGVLDVTVLSNCVLEPLLGIKDLRRDKRIDFVGGIRGLGELERRVDNGEMKVAFALYPVSMQQLIDIADSGMIMPPKTTWFEPKLRSGLVVHEL